MLKQHVKFLRYMCNSVLAKKINYTSSSFNIIFWKPLRIENIDANAIFEALTFSFLVHECF